MSKDQRYIIQREDVATGVWYSGSPYQEGPPPEFYRSVIEALERRDRINARLQGAPSGQVERARVVDMDGRVIEYRTKYVGDDYA